MVNKHEDVSEVIDLRKETFEPGSPPTVEGLQTVYKELGDFLALHLNTVNLEVPEPQIVDTAAYTHICLGRALMAIEAGDVDYMVHTLILYGEANKELWSHTSWGATTLEALFDRDENKRKRRESRLDKRVLSDVKDMTFQVAYARHVKAKAKDWLKKVTDDVSDHIGQRVSTRTVRRELEKRGILDTST